MKNILFIGNSHTYFENMPFLFTEICGQAGFAVRAVMCAAPDVDLAWHLAMPGTMPNVRFGKNDYVVIQQRAHPFDGADALIEQGTALIGEIMKAEATAVLVNTWSEKNNPGGQDTINEAHERLAGLTGCLLARCGPAWHNLRGVLDLYAGDGEHMSPPGAYLNSCVLAKTIFGVDPAALPGSIETDTLSRKLTEGEIRLLQRAAADI